MTLGERGGRKESIEGRIYGGKDRLEDEEGGAKKHYASDFHPLSSEETSIQETFTSFVEKLLPFFQSFW